MLFLISEAQLAERNLHLSDPAFIVHRDFSKPYRIPIAVPIITIIRNSLVTSHSCSINGKRKCCAMVKVAVDIDLNEVAVKAVPPCYPANDFIRFGIIRANYNVEILFVVDDFESGFLGWLCSIIRSPLGEIPLPFHFVPDRIIQAAIYGRRMRINRLGCIGFLLYSVVRSGYI